MILWKKAKTNLHNFYKKVIYLHLIIYRVLLAEAEKSLNFFNIIFYKKLIKRIFMHPCNKKSMTERREKCNMTAR